MTSHLSTSDYEAMLRTERKELVDELAELGVGNEGLDYDPNFADVGQVTAERTEQEVLVATLHDALVDVDAALAKLAAGTFGTCERCHEPIVADRLQAKPAARRCVTCAAFA